MILRISDLYLPVRKIAFFFMKMKGFLVKEEELSDV